MWTMRSKDSSAQSVWSISILLSRSQSTLRKLTTRKHRCCPTQISTIRRVPPFHQVKWLNAYFISSFDLVGRTM
ncbi:hypothetical protein ANCCAN_29473 [Ancylostoma caninum]|uniref:Uncharacterized protein n=1 Tax=Ancylostoma caninum TaxID=29170 RepID=A0A368EYG5_ANCCA|nr:hypothetical protein ANCCAN_29473 [Ancylostoma caninum]